MKDNFMLLRYNSLDKFFHNDQICDISRRKEKFYCIYFAEIQSYQNCIFTKIGYSYNPRQRIMILNKQLNLGGNKIIKISLLPSSWFYDFPKNKHEEFIHVYFQDFSIKHYFFDADVNEVVKKFFNCTFLGKTEIFLFDLKFLDLHLTKIIDLPYKYNKLNKMNIHEVAEYLDKNKDCQYTLNFFINMLNDFKITKFITAKEYNNYVKLYDDIIIYG